MDISKYPRSLIGKQKLSSYRDKSRVGGGHDNLTGEGRPSTSTENDYSSYLKAVVSTACIISLLLTIELTTTSSVETHAALVSAAARACSLLGHGGIALSSQGLHPVARRPALDKAESLNTSESSFLYLELAFRISVVNSNTAQKGTSTE